ncbi:hypothetical protein G9P44_001120 [Scheffersomyces stipitis]|nr:hypothetical protein G9P44_001120 [Scheffersomyces stipitis]
MSSETPDICCFCLGGDTDIPPFGKLSDAQDFIHPCSTCSLVAHKVCLKDWLNSLPSDKIQIVNPQSMDLDEYPTAATPGSRNDFASFSSAADLGVGVGVPATETRVHIHLSLQSVVSWLTNLSLLRHHRSEERTIDNNNTNVDDNDNITINDDTNGNVIENENNNTNNNTPFPSSIRVRNLKNRTNRDAPLIAVLIASCPQCKSDIAFTMWSSSFSAANAVLRTTATRVVQYGGIILAVTSVFTGILSMGYIGLTTCGLKMMDCIVPGPLLVRMLTRKSAASANNYASLSQILFSNNGNGNIPSDSLEQALVKGIIDPLKFSRIPVLPIVLYRLRSTSLLSSIFGEHKDSANNWIAEIMINAYISSLGNHQLVKSLFYNFRTSLADIIRDPSKLSRNINLFKNINLWRTNNIIGMLIPLRWLYDIFFRLTFNVAHLNNTMSSRPRTIANSMNEEEINRMENTIFQLAKLSGLYSHVQLTVDSELKAEVKQSTNSIYKVPLIGLLYVNIKRSFLLLSRLYNLNYFQDYIKTRAFLSYCNVSACLKNDFSHSLLNKSSTIRMITTVLWPYLSSKVGAVVFSLLFKNLQFSDKSITPAKLMLVSNIIGLVGVVLVKDMFNLYMAHRKAIELSDIRVLRKDSFVYTGGEDNLNLEQLRDWYRDQDNDTDIEVELELTGALGELPAELTDLPGGYPAVEE